MRAIHYVQYPADGNELYKDQIVYKQAFIRDPRAEVRTEIISQKRFDEIKKMDAKQVQALVRSKFSSAITLGRAIRLVWDVCAKTKWVLKNTLPKFDQAA